ncbi:MAG: acetyl-CoA carboxylase biotin carboxylase subunit [Planctomycetota bacterium]
MLIANRGEIAVRIAQTLREMGIAVIAVYSEPDRGAPHVVAADEAYPLAGKTSAETYLRGDQLVEIARQHDVDAIHPGYGFLAENAGFAQACADAGVTFIGPTPEAIRSMGDKVVAKALMREAGVPVVPGAELDPDADAEAIAAAADDVGYPLLVKAAAGGGGKGMRVVESAGALADAMASAQREAQAAFGDPRVFLERYVPRARHVEFQIFGDTHGHSVHLFERECSVQRRHQKIIEEAPSPALTPELRERMGAAAVDAARAIGYVNAGTVEFMLDDDGAFYFLEVNTRLQVEHPVTELTIHEDLVRAQILVASGAPLPFTGLTQQGHAVECRIYAEDAERDFMPSTGVIEQYLPPMGPGVRVDSGVAAGSEVTVHYDPMLAKLITWGADRDEALARMVHALDRYVVVGVTTNIPFLREVLEHEAFRAGALHTHFLDEHGLPAARDGDDPPVEALIAAAIGALASPTAAASASGPARADGPWQSAGAWRNT